MAPRALPAQCNGRQLESLRLCDLLQGLKFLDAMVVHWSRLDRATFLGFELRLN